MTTQYFDDGSTLTYDYSSPSPSVSSTEAPTSYYETYNGSSFPSSKSLTDALSYGFGRWVDYRTRPEPVQNTQMQLPRTYMTQPTGLGGLLSGDLMILLIIGGAIYALAK